MSVCRLGYPWRRSIRFIDRATQEPVDMMGHNYSLVTVDATSGVSVILTTFTTAQGYITPAASGRLIIDVPAIAMTQPLRKGSFGAEIRRDDGMLFGAFTQIIHGIDDVVNSGDAASDLIVIADNPDLVIEVEVGIPGRDAQGVTDMLALLNSGGTYNHTHHVTQVLDMPDPVLIFENQLI
jgi:hypothetical protein